MGLCRSHVRLVAAAVVALALAPAVAQADSVKHSGSVVEERIDSQGGCEKYTFFKWSALPGAVSYTLDMHDTLGYSFVATFPPYEYDGALGEFPAVGKGQHRHALTYQGGGVGGCQANDVARYTVNSFVANFDDKARIVGTVTGDDDVPVPKVKISISGASNASETTNAAGAYGTVVKKGRHRVRAPQGFCVRGGGSCKNSTSVDVRKTEVVNFVRKGEVTLSGGVLKRVCVDIECNTLEVAPAPNEQVVARDSSGNDHLALTNDRGNYSIDVPAGHYDVFLNGENRSPEPQSRSVDANDDVRHLDFKICTPPPGAFDQGEQAPGCNLVEVSGVIWDVERKPYKGATVVGPGDRSLTGANGRFSLLVPKGRVELTAYGEIGLAQEPESLRATKRRNELPDPIVIRPKIVVHQASLETVLVGLDGLPRSQGLQVGFRRDTEGQTSGCTNLQRAGPVSFQGGEGYGGSIKRAAVVEITPAGLGSHFSAFCPGAYTAIFRLPGAPTEKDQFEIAGP